MKYSRKKRKFKENNYIYCLLTCGENLEKTINIYKHFISRLIKYHGKLDYFHKFEYHVPYKDVGSENEICGTLVGIIDKDTKLKKIEGEIDEIKWISPKELIKEIKIKPEIYCPWMLIALQLLEKSEQSMLKKHENILSAWINTEIHEGIKIPSPIIGTAYLAPEPGGKKFADVGKKIKKGDTIMIVEAMKTMNHVPCPSDGVIKEICVEDGQPVEYGQTIAILN